MKAVMKLHPRIEFEAFFLNLNSMLLGIPQPDVQMTKEEMTEAFNSFFKLGKKQKRKIASGGQMVDV